MYRSIGSKKFGGFCISWFVGKIIGQAHKDSNIFLVTGEGEEESRASIRRNGWNSSQT